MGAVGRILQVIGWLWIASGFFSNFIDLPFQGSVLPGFVLIFVARILRTQAKRQQRMEEQEEVVTDNTATPAPVTIEPPRRPAPKVETAEPEVSTRAQERITEMQTRATAAASRDATEREDVLEKILLAGQDLREDEVESKVESDGVATPLTSAEMIAQARRRWDRQP